MLIVERSNRDYDTNKWKYNGPPFRADNKLNYSQSAMEQLITYGRSSSISHRFERTISKFAMQIGFRQMSALCLRCNTSVER